MDFNNTPHRRKNILTGEWVLVSPHRTKRPWQGKKDKPQEIAQATYDPNCYLCPGNERAGGAKNPTYTGTYSFQNDFAALLEGPEEPFKMGLLEAESESGICKVICYSPNHSLTLPLMEEHDVEKVISLWQKEYTELGSDPNINHVQIFENKGVIMGCSNPHPHGQIWAQRSIPQEVQKKVVRQKSYWDQNKKSLLGDYLQQELDAKERIVLENESFVALVPYWAVWPFETMIVPKRHITSILELTDQEVAAYARILKALTIRYDNLFETSFPYSAGIHQAPTDGKDNSHWHMHMSFYPPLLRSAEVKKFMVGYEMFANPQRDITAEQAAQRLRDCATTHYKN
ncbi:MAG: UDP-glucose--hexose-1-phosphate uridylyltransferase [Flavobacteriaceae bacterium]|jgi:UDPglucose--hexose-1-phosphate uridylyltransferase|nr:UDP-glucose--hexose-1-phosphate uridylyltransferase [Flavobacteriaceae bacterium]